jgi:hypothetical protein
LRPGERNFADLEHADAEQTANADPAARGRKSPTKGRNSRKWPAGVADLKSYEIVTGFLSHT